MTSIKTNMCCLFFVVLLLCQCTFTYMEKLDGTKLSNQLKMIRDGVGVTHMQNVFDKLPYQPKTGDGDELLNNIKTNIEDDLRRLTNILLNVQSEVLNQEQKFTPQTTLPKCCNISENHLKYDPKFRHKVNFTTACVTISRMSGDDAKYPPKELGDVMKNTYDNDKNILWQHYGTHDGTSVIYPATKWDDCRTYDPRLRPAYTATASPKDKDLVLVIDSSSSMKHQSGVENKQKILIAKEAANVVIQSLSPNDRVAVISFNADVIKGSDCYSDVLAYATKDNIAKLKEFVVSVTPDSSESSKNFEKAIQAAFSYLQKNSTNRDQIILFVSDGMFNAGQDPREVIRDENMKIQNKAVIFTYLLNSGEETDADTLFQEMASQVLSNGSYGNIREGNFSNLDSKNHKKLTIAMVSFYLKIQHGLKRSIPKFSVPFVDPFSKVGLMTSMCVPAHVTSKFHGVACTDIKVGELLKDVEFFEEGNSTYAFLVAQSGMTIAHPLLPDPNYIKIDEDPVQVDISALERSSGSAEILEKMKSGESGNKTLKDVYFTIPRGTLVNDGSSVQILKATFFWTPISNTGFTIAIVLGDESHSEITEVGLDSDHRTCFMYHDRSLKSDNYQNCRFNSRLATLDRSSVKFAPSAFENPFQYIDKDETALDVTNYEKYFTKQTNNNPGFKANIRADVWATYEAEKFWKNRTSNHLSWRYIGTKSGIMRVYPGVSLTKTYDHEKRPWFRQTISHPEMIYITPPYEDAWGSGILLSQEHTIHKRNSRQVTAVLGTDFPLQYFNWFIDQIYPSCASSEYRCIIIEDNGFIVMHPSFKESTNADAFTTHITEKEPALAKELVNNNVLNKQECQDLSVKKDLRSYRVTMPVDKSAGLKFADTNNKFELTPIPETNIFIIRQMTPSGLTPDCKCDDGIKPDYRRCSECDCLCYNDLKPNVCLNRYSVVGSLPCSARLPDTSGVSTPEDITNFPTCFNPMCSTKSSKTECFSDAECGWCEFTVEGYELDQQCCRLKEDCYFGKTSSISKDTCGARIVSTTGQDKNVQGSPTADKTNSIIIGSTTGAVAVAIIVAIFVVVCVRRKNKRHQMQRKDIYIYAVHDDGEICEKTNDKTKEPHAHLNEYFTPCP